MLKKRPNPLRNQEALQGVFSLTKQVMGAKNSL